MNIERGTNMKRYLNLHGLIAIAALMAFCSIAGGAYAADQIVHDAEYYILESQNGERWAAEDEELETKLKTLRNKHGRPPNIIHIMWDDTAYGDVGIPAIQKVRGLETPRLNTMAEEGILFTRMYTEVGCTPSRAASATGRLAIRSGMYNIGMLLESHGMRGEEVTIAEVLSQAGYATAFHGKWHLGDIEESYPHNQGFDEAFFTGYNQILSLNTRVAEGANASMGLYEDMLPPDPYKLDDTFVTKGWVQVAEGRKGEKARQWGDNSHETDLFTTFARLAGATQYIPTDRIIDGIDQTALLMSGDTYGRRDHVFIYAGPNLGATVKGNYKRHWISPDPVGEASGIPAAFYFLPSDPREMTPMLVNLIHLKSPFNRMKLRHELWKKKYPDAKEVHGIPWTGIENATPGVQALARPNLDLEKLPFDPLEYVEYLDQLPFDPNLDPELGR
jgi:hypothetical protein